ncbi:peptidoglycan-associated lipoprotein Pal [Candidatus Providencia siddallii]|uniref:Peptidoglycan-associated lipoprotein n=1 Tax=Candidatus Providencia siddallii TaxID=1715285 RepID=A0ABM9NNF4_9GAMM
MHLKKILKSLVIVLPIIMFSSCTSNKNDEQDNIEPSTNQVDNVLPSKDSLHQQGEQLQQNNIIYFSFDKYNISQEYMNVLDNYIMFLRDNSSNVIIEGHADERGTPEYNIALGEKRANAVKLYLQSKGISNKQISIVSYGEEKPASLGSTEDDYAKNRRAVIVSQ